MSNLEILLAQNQLPLDYQPQIIQLFFDGVEVLRIESGHKVYEKLVRADMTPELMEMYWDREVVYALKTPPPSVDNPTPQSLILVNRMLLLIDGV